MGNPKWRGRTARIRGVKFDKDQRLLQSTTEKCVCDSSPKRRCVCGVDEDQQEKR